MNIRKFLLLLAIAGALLGYIKFVELPEKRSTELKEHPFKDLNVGSLSTISIEANGSSPFVLENSKVAPESKNVEAPSTVSDDDLQGWKIKDVVDGEIEKATFNALISSIKNLTLNNFIAPEDVGDELAPFGLDNPSLKLVLKTPTKEYLLSLGANNSYIKKRYLKFGDAAGLYLVDEGLFDAASKKRDQFRDLTPIDLKDSDVASIEVVKDQSHLNFEKQGSTWTIIKPAKFTGDSIKIGGLLRELRNIKAEEFYDGSSAAGEQYGLSLPYLTAKVVFKDESKLTPLVVNFGVVGKEEKKFFVRLSNKSTVYRIGGATLAAFDKPIDDFREHELNRFMINNVSEVSIVRSAAETTKLTKSGEVWKVDDSKDGDLPFVDNFIRDLSLLRAIGFPSEGQALGFDKPYSEIFIKLKGEGDSSGKIEERKLVIGNQLSVDGQPSSDGARFAATGDLSEPFIISSEDLKKILPSKETLLASDRVEGTPIK